MPWCCVKTSESGCLGKFFSDLFPGKSLQSLVLREIVSGLIHGEVVAGVVAEAGSVGLTAVEGLARLVLGELAAGLAPGEPPEEGIAGLLVGSNLTAHSRSSVGGSRVDGKR